MLRPGKSFVHHVVELSAEIPVEESETAKLLTSTQELCCLVGDHECWAERLRW